MPLRPLKPCNQPACSGLTDERYCGEHKKQEATLYDRKRGSAASRGYDARWRRARKLFLAEHPLCIECEATGRVEAATVVDHRIPHKGDQVRFWDVSNWQPLCQPHHDRKTATQDGRWG